MYFLLADEILMQNSRNSKHSELLILKVSAHKASECGKGKEHLVIRVISRDRRLTRGPRFSETTKFIFGYWLFVKTDYLISYKLDASTELSILGPEISRIDRVFTMHINVKSNAALCLSKCKIARLNVVWFYDFQARALDDGDSKCPIHDVIEKNRDYNYSTDTVSCSVTNHSNLEHLRHLLAFTLFFPTTIW